MCSLPQIFSKALRYAILRSNFRWKLFCKVDFHRKYTLFLLSTYELCIKFSLDIRATRSPVAGIKVHEKTYRFRPETSLNIAPCTFCFNLMFLYKKFVKHLWLPWELGFKIHRFHWREVWAMNSQNGKCFCIKILSRGFYLCLLSSSELTLGVWTNLGSYNSLQYKKLCVVWVNNGDWIKLENL